MQKETRPQSGGHWGGFGGRFLQAVRANRKLELAIYGGLILVVVALYASTLLPSKELAKDTSAEVSKNAAPETEQRLKAVLSRIRGAGQVEVMITYETGTELVAAMTTSINSNASETSDGDKVSSNTQTTQSSEPATVGGGSGDEPIILMEKEPVVRGVLVVAEGAADIRVKLDLQRAVQAALDVPLSRIEVFESALALP